MSADLFNNSLSLSLPPHSLTFIRKKDGLLFTAHKNMLVTQQVLKTMKSKWMIITFVWKSVIFLCQNNYIVAVPSLFAFFFHLTNGGPEVGWAECVCVCVCLCVCRTNLVCSAPNDFRGRFSTDGNFKTKFVSCNYCHSIVSVETIQVDLRRIWNIKYGLCYQTVIPLGISGLVLGYC